MMKSIVRMKMNHGKLSNFALMSIEDDILRKIIMDQLIKDCQNQIPQTTLSQVEFSRGIQVPCLLYFNFILLSDSLRKFYLNFAVLSIGSQWP